MVPRAERNVHEGTANRKEICRDSGGPSAGEQLFGAWLYHRPWGWKQEGCYWHPERLGWSGAGAGEGNEEKGKTPQAGSGAWGDRTCSARIPCSLQVKQNLLSVSYHIAQYTSIIADLRGEIQRLKCKIDEQGGRGQARARLERGDIRHIQGVCVCGGRPR